MENPLQSYRATPVIWDHTVLPASRRRWNPRPEPSKPVLDLPNMLDRQKT